MEVPQVVVPSARAAMAPFAAAFWGDPTAELKVVGVTGTNGKTTTAYLVREILEAAGVQTGLMGTVKQVVGGEEEAVERTTPEAIDLQETFRRMIEGGDRACAMEVSSHAMVLHRADAIHFDVAVFTNLTQDHLDFHADMEDYFAAKRMLFDGRRRGCGSSTSTTPTAAASPRNSTAVTFSAEGADADYRATDVSFDAGGATFTVSMGRKPDDAVFGPSTPRCGCGRGCRGTSTSPTRSGPSRRPRRSGSTRRPRPPGSPPRRGCRGASSRSTRARGSPSSSTTPTRPTRWRTCCGRRAGSPTAG